MSESSTMYVNWLTNLQLLKLVPVIDYFFCILNIQGNTLKSTINIEFVMSIHLIALHNNLHLSLPDSFEFKQHTNMVHMA